MKSINQNLVIYGGLAVLSAALLVGAYEFSKGAGNAAGAPIGNGITKIIWTGGGGFLGLLAGGIALAPETGGLSLVPAVIGAVVGGGIGYVAAPTSNILTAGQ